MLARQVLFLQQYDFVLIHKNGTEIPHVDALSRTLNDEEENEHISELLALNEKKIINEYSNELDENELNNLSLENVRLGQKKDSFYSSMYYFLHTGNLYPDTKHSDKIRTQCNEYTIQNKLLYHLRTDRNNVTIKQLCIPKEFRTIIMSSLHDMKSSAHQSTAKCYNRAVRRFYWRGMNSDIQNYVQSCHSCMASNTGHYPKAPLQNLQVSKLPFERIHYDLLRIKTLSRGYQYILVIIDSFSRYIVTVPLKHKTAPSVIQLCMNIGS